MNYYLPPKRGLYDPAFEHDACGVGFIAHIKGEKSHRIIEQAIRILVNLTHRGAVGSDALTGDGAGLLFQLPDEFFRNGTAGLDFDLPPAGGTPWAWSFCPVTVSPAGSVCASSKRKPNRAACGSWGGARSLSTGKPWGKPPGPIVRWSSRSFWKVRKWRKPPLNVGFIWPGAG